MAYYLSDTGVQVHAWASIKDQTSIKWVTDEDGVEFTFGGPQNFELLATRQGLRNLVEAGARALEELERR